MDKGYKLQGCQVQKGPKLAISSFKKGQILKKENCFRISLNIVRFAHVVPKQAFKSTIYFNIQKRPKNVQIATLASSSSRCTVSTCLPTIITFPSHMPSVTTNKRHMLRSEVFEVSMNDGHFQ